MDEDNFTFHAEEKPSISNEPYIDEAVRSRITKQGTLAFITLPLSAILSVVWLFLLTAGMALGSQMPDSTPFLLFISIPLSLAYGLYFLFINRKFKTKIWKAYLILLVALCVLGLVAGIISSTFLYGEYQKRNNFRTNFVSSEHISYNNLSELMSDYFKYRESKDFNRLSLMYDKDEDVNEVYTELNFQLRSNQDKYSQRGYCTSDSLGVYYEIPLQTASDVSENATSNILRVKQDVKTGKLILVAHSVGYGFKDNCYLK